MRTTDELDCYLAQERQNAFEWTSKGNGDCMLFIAGWGERIGWPSAGTAWRGQYTTELAARRLLARRGGAVWAFCEAFGPPRIGSESRRGDVALLETDGWHLAMICTGKMFATRYSERGVGLFHCEPDLVWNLGFA